MIFAQKKRTSNNLKFFIILMAVLALLVFLNVRGWFSFPGDVFLKIVAPINRIFMKTGKTIFSGFDSLARLRTAEEQNSVLVAERNKLLSEVSQLQEAERENLSLRELLKISKENPKRNFILAKITGLNFNNFQDGISINKGSKASVVKNAPVIVRDNIILGIVSNLYPDFSQVETIFNKNFSVAAMDEATGAKGMVRGWFANELLFDTILKEDNLNVGDLVTTSGLDGIWPGGILIGKVKRVEKTDIDVFQKAYLEPLVDLRKIDDVFVITNTD